MSKVRRDRRRARVWLIPVGVIFATALAAILWFANDDRFNDVNRAPYITFVGTVSAATLAGIVALRVSLVFPARLKRIELLLAYVEKQLSDLWGPLYGAVSLSQYHYAQLLPELEQEGFYEEGSGDEEALILIDDHPVNGVVIRRAPVSVDPFSLIVEGEDKGGALWVRWMAYAETYALPWNKRVAKLLTRNYALIGQDHLPDIQRFLAHEAEYRAVHEKVVADQAMDSFGPNYELDMLFPEAFEYQIYHKVRFLFYLQKKYRLQIDGSVKSELEETARKGARHREMSRSRPAKRLGRAQEHWAFATNAKLGRSFPIFTTRRATSQRIDLIWMLAQLAIPVSGSQMFVARRCLWETARAANKVTNVRLQLSRLQITRALKDLERAGLIKSRNRGVGVFLNHRLSGQGWIISLTTELRGILAETEQGRLQGEDDCRRDYRIINLDELTVTQVRA